MATDFLVGDSVLYLRQQGYTVNLILSATRGVILDGTKQKEQAMAAAGAVIYSTVEKFIEAKCSLAEELQALKL